MELVSVESNVVGFFGWFGGSQGNWSDEMARQYVTEIHVNQHVLIRINGVDAKHYFKNQEKYKDYVDNDVKDLKEYEEVRDGNAVKYWVWVPDTVKGARIPGVEKKNKTYWDKQARKKVLIAEKWERIHRYAEQAEKGEEIWGTPEDFVSGMALMQLEDRQYMKLFPRAPHHGVSKVVTGGGKSFDFDGNGNGSDF